MAYLRFLMLFLFLAVRGFSVETSNNSESKNNETKSLDNLQSEKPLQDFSLLNEAKDKSLTNDEKTKTDKTFLSQKSLVTLGNEKNKDKNEIEKKPCDECKCDTEIKRCRIVDIEFKPAYFFPQDSVFKEIYEGGFIALGELSFYIYKNYLTLFIESGYFSKTGKINDVDSKVHTSVCQVPVTLGFVFNYPIFSNFDIYAKIGPNYLYTKVKQQSSFFKPKEIINCYGGTFGAGVKYLFLRYCLLDLFFNYRFDKKEIHDSLSDSTFQRYLGGFDLGLGVGCRF
jgi:hypothetical protein